MFLACLVIVARFAKPLKVVQIEELLGVAFVIIDVINHSTWSTIALFAYWITRQNKRNRSIPPCPQVVQMAVRFLIAETIMFRTLRRARITLLVIGTTALYSATTL